MTDKRNGVPTLRAAAQELSVVAFLALGLHPDSPEGQRVHARMARAVLLTEAALRTDRDLSARRTRRRRGTDIHAPVTPTPLRGNRM